MGISVDIRGARAVIMGTSAGIVGDVVRVNGANAALGVVTVNGLMLL